MTLKKRINALVKEIAKREGGKVELDAPQIREVLRCLAIIEAEYWNLSAPDGIDVSNFIFVYCQQNNIQRIAKRNVKARQK